MGLDMYLSAKHYIWSKDRENFKISGLDEERYKIKVENVKVIEEEVGYWRKANAIHKWFVENVQNGVDDCGDYYVSEEKLEMLLNDVNRVLADHSSAELYLPAQSGFFFGSTEYNDWYFEDLKLTKEIIEDVLVRDIGTELYYHSSW